MWVAEFEFDGTKMKIGKVAKEIGISASIHLRSFNPQQDGTVLTNYLMVTQGSKEQIETFTRKVAEQEGIAQVERFDNLVLCQLIEGPQVKALYQPELVFLEPWELNYDGKGTERGKVYSWKRNTLTAFADMIFQIDKGRLIRIHETSIADFTVMSSNAQLTQKQMQAFELAVRHGYYEVPRKITLEALSKLMTVNYSTFQVHLRKAERVMLPRSMQILHQYN